MIHVMVVCTGDRKRSSCTFTGVFAKRPFHFRQNAAFSGGKDAPQIKKVQAGRMCRAS